MDRLRRRGAEIARAHRHFREATARAAERELAESRAPQPPQGRLPRLGDAIRSVAGRPGRDQARRGIPDPQLAERAAALVESGVFDAAWYERQNPEVRAAGQDPLRHYLESGWRNGRNPNALFHEAWYRQQNATTLQPEESGLEHYLRSGAAAGCRPNPLFDAEWYLNLNPDVRSYKPGPLTHFLHFGGREGRDPHPLFDTDWFLREYGNGAIPAGENPLAYFLDAGVSTGHSPCEL